MLIAHMNDSVNLHLKSIKWQI